MQAASPGDIVLFRLNIRHPLAWLRPWALLIAWFQGSPVTHTALVADPKWGVLIEAYYPRVRKALFEDTIWEKCYDWDIVRPAGSTEKQRNLAVKYALKLIGRKYDTRSLWDLAKWLLVEKIFGVFVRNRVTIGEDNDRFFCQELVTQCYERAGFPLAEKMGFTDAAAVLPADVDLNRKLFVVIESSHNWPTYD